MTDTWKTEVLFVETIRPDLSLNHFFELRTVMNTTPDTIEDEVLRDIEKPENPYKRYRVEFPFTCTFTIPEDGHNTRVTIETRSEHLHHA